MSLRAQNLTTPTLKVNDGRGNPIEIGAVVVWRVQDTARAAFEVESFAEYVRLQCESALREVASRHAYDHADETLLGGRVRTLRSDAERISETLRLAIQSHVEVAGIAIDEARIAHLAYAPEIAQVMLRRQQAEAVLAARRKLVEGAVGHGGDGAHRHQREEPGHLHARAESRAGDQPDDRAGGRRRAAAGDADGVGALSSDKMR